MRFTHHAKNRARLNKLTPAEVEAIASNPLLECSDENGNPSYLGYVGTQLFRVIEAADEPGFDHHRLSGGQALKADYDSEANALSIDFFEPDQVDRVEKVGGSACLVWIRGGRPFSVELLNPGKHLDRLAMAARRFDLDATALSAAAHAALAAPDHVVTIDVAAAVPA